MRSLKRWRGPDIRCIALPSARSRAAENPKNCWSASGFPPRTSSVLSAPSKRWRCRTPRLEFFQLRFLVVGQELKDLGVDVRAGNREVGLDRRELRALIANQRLVHRVGGDR